MSRTLFRKDGWCLKVEGLQGLVEDFCGHFWTFRFFDIFERKIAFFRQFFLNFPQFAPRGEVICDHHNFWSFSAVEIGLKISESQK